MIHRGGRGGLRTRWGHRTLTKMNQTLKYKMVGICLLLTVFFSAGTYLYAHRNHDVSAVLNNPPPIVKMHALLAIPLADDRVLMGASHNVFIGKVISQIGTRAVDLGHGNMIPVSQFSVEPISNIKGNLQGTVTVEQSGGYQDGVLLVNEDG